MNASMLSEENTATGTRERATALCCVFNEYTSQLFQHNGNTALKTTSNNMRTTKQVRAGNSQDSRKEPHQTNSSEV